MKRTPVNRQGVAKKLRESIPPGPPPKIEARQLIAEAFRDGIPPARAPAPPQAVEARPAQTTSSTPPFDPDGTKWLNQVRNEFSRRLAEIEKLVTELKDFCRRNNI